MACFKNYSEKKFPISFFFFFEKGLGTVAEHCFTFTSFKNICGIVHKYTQYIKTYIYIYIYMPFQEIFDNDLPNTNNEQI